MGSCPPYPNLPKRPSFLTAGSEGLSLFRSADASPISNFCHVMTTYFVRGDTFDVCARAKEAALACQHCEDGVWVIIEDAEC